MCIWQKYCVGVEESYSNSRDDVIASINSKVTLTFTQCTWDPFYVDHVAVGKSHSDDVFNKNKLLNAYAQSGRFRFDDSSDVCQLLITNIQEKDAGTYSCRENNGLGKRCDIELIVLGTLSSRNIGSLHIVHQLDIDIIYGKAGIDWLYFHERLCIYFTNWKTLHRKYAGVIRNLISNLYNILVSNLIIGGVNNNRNFRSVLGLSTFIRVNG